MSTPPPLPQQVKFIRFEGSIDAILAAGHNGEKVLQATTESQIQTQQQALNWLNKNPDLEVISIDSSFVGIPLVTVWYRQ